MYRRQLLKFLCASIPACEFVHADSQVTLFFVDGYHGGVRGHMPPGAWRDIVNRLAETPRWKLCLDIEALSWKRLAETDPASLARLTTYLHSPPGNPRVELVGGTFAQPYGWAMLGESNIRQLTRGLAEIRDAFPGIVVETYAVQEPCWASCLPQILKSLGFRYAVLKNPSTAWGGYSVGVDQESVNWVGPDGSGIPTVTRYACEELLDTWRTEAQTGSIKFAEKCLQHGIQHPAGMCFQDLGWSARPNAEGDHLRFVTWREYMHDVAASKRSDWSLGIEGTRCSLPWGEQTLQRMARQVRQTELRLSQAEKMASLAAVSGNQTYPSRELQDAEEQLLWSQHHDTWITATTRSGREAWAFQAASETWQADNILDGIISTSLQSMSSGKPTADSNTESHLEVWNTLAHDRTALVETEVALDPGSQSITIEDQHGQVIPSQYEMVRKYAGAGVDRVRGAVHSQQLGTNESLAAVRLIFPAQVSATSSATYRIVSSPHPTEADTSGVRATQNQDGSITVDSDLYRVHFDAAKGGTISSLFVKQSNREFCASGPRCFHEFRGYFIEATEWASSTSRRASLTIEETGPVRVTVAIAGLIASVPYRTHVTIAQGQRRIEIETRFQFDSETWIGDPWTIKPEDRMKGRRRSEYDDRFKLLALFPLSMPANTIYKNAAFDVCKSQNVDTFFDSWDKIKHNIIVNWVDAFDAESNTGLAVMTDHTTSYAQGPDHPLGLVLAWGWDGGYWWGKCPLKGVQEARYAIVPHVGTWDKAGLWSEAETWMEPLLGQISNTTPTPSRPSVVRSQDGGLRLSALQIHEGHLHVRFFNAESDAADHVIEFGFKPQQVEQIELDSRIVRRLAIQRAGSYHRVTISVPRFGLCTLRLPLDRV